MDKFERIAIVTQADVDADVAALEAQIAAEAATARNATNLTSGTVALARLAGITDGQIAAANKDGTAGTPSLRTLGTGAAQAAQGSALAAEIVTARNATNLTSGIVADARIASTIVRVGAEKVFSEDYRLDSLGATRSDDDTISAAIAAAFPSAASGMVKRLLLGTAGGVPVPYSLTTNHVIGAAGRRYYGAHLAGFGRGLSRIDWNGDPASGPFTFLNVHMPTVEEFSMGPFPSAATVRPAFWIKFDVENGQSGFRIRTKNLDFYDAVVGMQLGTGHASAQMNQGLHEGLGFLACDTPVDFNAPSGEIQTFEGFDIDQRVAGSTCFRVHASKGLHLKGGEVTYHAAGDNYLVRATGNCYGGGFKIEDVRLEEAWCIASFLNADADYTNGIQFPLDIEVNNVVVQRSNYTLTDPCDVVQTAYQGTVSFNECEFPQPNSRARVIGLTNTRVAVTAFRECKINNAAALTDPSALFKVEASGSAFANGGHLGIVEGCVGMTTTIPHTVPANGAIPSQWIHQDQSQVGSGAVTRLVNIDTIARGVTIKPVTVTSAARPDPTSVASGALLYDSDLKAPITTTGTGWRDAIGRRRFLAVRAVAIAALPAATYVNGTAGVGATLTATANGALPAQDGITLVVADRVLVASQAAAPQNGIYVVTAVGDASNPWVLTRATDADSAAEVVYEALVPVTAGTVNAGKLWQLSTTGTITIGTTGQAWQVADPVSGSQKSRPDTFAVGSSTVTKPSWALTAEMAVQGASGGGGGGRRGAAGTARVGGGPGAAGGMSRRLVSAADLPGTFNVTVGAGGSAGAAATTDDTNGGNGGNGGASFFGPTIGSNYVAANGGTGGVGGGAGAGGTVGTAGAGMFTGGIGVAAPLTGAAAGGPGTGIASGGGPGGGITTADVASVGGTSTAPSARPGGSGAAGGAVPGGAGAAGFGPGTTAPGQGMGGGGGAGSVVGTGGAGGAGHLGGGGGGGGASQNGNNSGPGAVGGDGIAAITWFG